MAGVNIFLSFMFLAWLTKSAESAPGRREPENYVQDACSVTRYRDLCVHSLASFSKVAKRSPSIWARAGVSVTIGEAKNVSQYLIKLQNNRAVIGGGRSSRNRVALSDCIECFQEAIDQLHKSLGVLRRLSRTTFNEQMADLNTWVSAALTNEGTCLDGFGDGGGGGGGGGGQKGKEVIKLLQNRVLNATYITSNALALVNKLASTGLGSLIDP